MKKLIIVLLLFSSVISYAQDIKVFPNPVKSGSDLYINAVEILEIKIFNMEGKLIIEKKSLNYLPINLPSGFYIVQVVTKTKTKNKKIIVI